MAWQIAFPNVTFEVSSRHQGNIDGDRHPDKGSSCCGLFAAHLTYLFLNAPEDVTSWTDMPQLEEMCGGCDTPLEEEDVDSDEEMSEVHLTSTNV